MSWHATTIVNRLHELLPEYRWKLTPCEEDILLIEGSAKTITGTVSRLKFTYHRQSDRVVHASIGTTNLHKPMNNQQLVGANITYPAPLDQFLLTAHNAGVARLAQAGDIRQALFTLVTLSGLQS